MKIKYKFVSVVVVCLMVLVVWVLLVIFEVVGSDFVVIIVMCDVFCVVVGGGVVVGVNGFFGGLCCEINWDGVFDGFVDFNFFFLDFFNSNLFCGVVFSMLGIGFFVSVNVGFVMLMFFGFLNDF